MNTAIALAREPVRMARAMKLASRPAARRFSLAGCAQAVRREPQFADHRPHRLAP